MIFKCHQSSSRYWCTTKLKLEIFCKLELCKALHSTSYVTYHQNEASESHLFLHSQLQGICGVNCLIIVEILGYFHEKRGWI
jgi:hypothetical protein|uniref:Uncharacterized protein n=1 Tax=Populus trichocarpa TaxID=3694 RepID=A0A2K1XN73_POPTR